MPREVETARAKRNLQTNLGFINPLNYKMLLRTYR